MKTLRLEKTKKGLPALWESGGGATNTGTATIIAGAAGEALRPLYVRTRGQLSCSSHALFVVGEGMHIIRADHHRGDFTIRVYRIVNLVQGSFISPETGESEGAIQWDGCAHGETSGLYKEGPEAVLSTVTTEYDRGEWSGDFDPDDSPLRAAIEAAKEKATCYHCREPHYYKREDADQTA